MCMLTLFTLNNYNLAKKLNPIVFGSIKSNELLVWPQLLRIAPKGTSGTTLREVVPKFTIGKLLVWISLLLQILVVPSVAFGYHSESVHQIDLITELNLHNTTYSGLSFDKNFIHFNPAILLFDDNSRNIHYPSHVLERAAYLISESNEFTFIASVKQNKQNTGTILSFTKGINRLLELQSSGRKNEIRLHYRHNDVVYTQTFPFNIADEEWHKIALSVSGIHVDLYIDCNHIFRREIHEIDRHLKQDSNVTLWLGQRYVKHYLYRGFLRDVKIVAKPNGFTVQCPHLETECPTCGQFKTLQNSVMRLESVVRELTQKLLETELRLKRVEDCDCFKSCSVNGSIHPEGSTWKQDCDICSCVRGEVKCRPIYCPVLCKNPEIVPNECCPVCKKTCYWNGRVLQHNQRIKFPPNLSDKCGECVCNDGKTTCKQIIAETMCPPLNCPLDKQFYREEQCCKFCADDDFCGAGNDCHPNGTCHNLKSNYTCSCNRGFVGNGKVCHDINECDHKGGTDGHHCGQNTVCVNTLGSYECQCIEGFQRLDKYQCIDIDECSDQTNDCNGNSICINTRGSYECRCKPGYERRGSLCKPKCKQMCLNGGQCVKPDVCSCRKGYYGLSCEIDVDECVRGLHQCPSNSECVNKEGWYYCQCHNGYRRQIISDSNNELQIKCEDIDECSVGAHTCHNSAKCVNTDGGFSCECDSNQNKLCLNCNHNNEEHFDGQTWLSSDNSCEQCKCHRGVVICKKQTCDCGSSELNLECCPQCDTSDKVCRHQQDFTKTYRTGQTWIYDCQKCECMFGETDCWDLECPPTDCLNPIRTIGDCCPRCEDDPCQSTDSFNTTNPELKNSGCKHLGHYYHSGEKVLALQKDCASCLCQNGHLCCVYTSVCINQLNSSQNLTNVDLNKDSNSRIKRIEVKTDVDSDTDEEMPSNARLRQNRN